MGIYKNLLTIGIIGFCLITGCDNRAVPGLTGTHCSAGTETGVLCSNEGAVCQNRCGGGCYCQAGRWQCLGSVCPDEPDSGPGQIPDGQSKEDSDGRGSIHPDGHNHQPIDSSIVTCPTSFGAAENQSCGLPGLQCDYSHFGCSASCLCSDGIFLCSVSGLQC